MGSQTHDLPVCSIAPQSSIIKLIQLINTNTDRNLYYPLNNNNNENCTVRNCGTHSIL
jgi:hypothetical protein